MLTNRIKELAENDSDARDFFLWLKSADDSYKVLGARIAETQTGLDYYRLISLFKELDELQVGDFIVGRKGHDSRIVWNFDTHSVGLAGFQTFSIFEVMKDVPFDAVTAISPPQKNSGPEGISHNFNLRKNFSIELNLPEDFDQHDCNRLKNWLDLLVY